NGMPPFVALPEVIKDAGVNQFPGLNGGLLGKRFDPLLVESNATGQDFARPQVVVPDDLPTSRLGDRRLVREQVNQLAQHGTEPTTNSEMDGYYRQAFDILTSPEARQAFALEEEPARLREQYGDHLFGRGCLLARRLVERGVALVTVYWHYEGPDD